MKLLKLVRVWRWLLIAILIAQCALLVSDILGRHLLLAIVPVVLIPGLMYGLALNRRTIANVVEQSRPRPDYARIAALRSDTGRPLAEIVAAAERQAEQDYRRENGESQHGQEISAAEYEARSAAALTLASAGYDPADVLAAVHPEHGYGGIVAHWTQEAANPAPEPQRGTLGGMRPGDVCWAVPWALSADGDRLWLDAGYLAGRAPGGTGTVRVERRPDGYHAWSEPGEEVYVNEAVRPGKNSGRHYLPVTWHSGYPGVRVRVIKLEPKRTR